MYLSKETGYYEYKTYTKTRLTEEDKKIETSLRPQTLDSYIGQDRIKESVSIAIEAARGRHDALDHVLLYGPPGLGKTTLAGILSWVLTLK